MHFSIYDNINAKRSWKGVSATLQSGRYTLSYPRGLYIILKIKDKSDGVHLCIEGVFDYIYQRSLDLYIS